MFHLNATPRSRLTMNQKRINDIRLQKWHVIKLRVFNKHVGKPWFPCVWEMVGPLLWCAVELWLRGKLLYCTTWLFILTVFMISAFCCAISILIITACSFFLVYRFLWWLSLQHFIIFISYWPKSNNLLGTISLLDFPKSAYIH